MDVLIAFAAKIGAWISSIFPALAGVGLSLHLDGKKMEDMTIRQVLATFFFGVTVAYYFSHFAAETWNIDPLSYTFIFIQFSIAAIGMSILAQLILNVPAQIPKILDAMRNKWFGG
jgi:hypothetical protein